MPSGITTMDKVLPEAFGENFLDAAGGQPKEDS